MGRISYFQMEISLGRWNTKLFLGRRSYLLSKKRGYTKGSKTIRKIFIPQTRAAQTRRESSLRVFSQDVQFDSFGSQKTRIGRLEKTWSPILSIKKTRRRSEKSRLFKQMKAIIQCFNQTYAVQTRRESSLRFFSSRRPIWVFWRPKSPKEHLEKRFGGSIFSRRPIWAFWPPKNPKRASWEKVWWLDSWPSWKRFSYPAVLNHISPYIYSFQDAPGVESPNLFSRRSFWIFGGQKAKIGLLEKIKQQNWILPLKNLLIETCRKSVTSKIR